MVDVPSEVDTLVDAAPIELDDNLILRLIYDLAQRIHPPTTIAQRYGLGDEAGLKRYLTAHPKVVEQARKLRAIVESDKSAEERARLKPVGSGKSMGSIMEMLRRTCMQAPHNGVRYTRWAMIRNTLQQLKQTVLSDVQQYLQGAVHYKVTDSTVQIRGNLSDGTQLYSDWLLIPLDTKEDVRGCSRCSSPAPGSTSCVRCRSRSSTRCSAGSGATRARRWVARPGSG
jgi:hypothetical protein